MPKLQKEKTKKVIRYWRSGNIYPPNITDQLDKIIDSAINGGDGGVNNDQVFKESCHSWCVNKNLRNGQAMIQ